jgi:FixJ family two-component response regulator
LSEVPLICIVDDNNWARAGLEDLLLSFGYKTRAFESAETFLESHVVDQAACLITDLHMPGINGLDLQRILRCEGHDIPVIVVTAYPSDAYRADAFEGGALAFLTKPYDEQVLADCLTRAKCSSGKFSTS